MIRSAAENTVRRIAASLIYLEHKNPAIRSSIHGATLLLTQAATTSSRMKEPEALEALARAAEFVSEVLLLREVRGADARSVALIRVHGSELLAMAHQYALRSVTSSNNPEPSVAARTCNTPL